MRAYERVPQAGSPRVRADLPEGRINCGETEKVWGEEDDVDWESRRTAM